MIRRTCAVCAGLLTLAACGSSSPTPSTTVTSEVPTTSATSVASTTTTTSLVATTTTSTRLPTTTTSSQGSVPAPVTDVRAGPAGGSGEIEILWGAVADADGYRVYHATMPDGPFSLAADYDVATGTSTKASGVMNVYYTDEFGFVLIEVPSDAQTTGPQRYYRITAYNAAGEGPPSKVVCGAPTGYPFC